MRTERVRAWARDRRAAIVSVRAELLVAAAVLAGWASLTVGVRALAWGAGPRAVWPISTGLLLFSVCGWGFIGRVTAVGLYVLHKRAKAGKG